MRMEVPSRVREALVDIMYEVNRLRFLADGLEDQGEYSRDILKLRTAEDKVREALDVLLSVPDKEEKMMPFTPPGSERTLWFYSDQWTEYVDGLRATLRGIAMRVADGGKDLSDLAHALAMRRVAEATRKEWLSAPVHFEYSEGPGERTMTFTDEQWEGYMAELRCSLINSANWSDPAYVYNQKGKKIQRAREHRKAWLAKRRDGI